MKVLEEEKRCPDYMLDVVDGPAGTVITVQGWLDDIALREIVDRAGIEERDHGQPGVLDFRHVTYCDPSAIPDLRRLKARGWDLQMRLSLVAALLEEPEDTDLIVSEEGASEL